MVRLAVGAALLCLAMGAQAERADREKPVNIEADRMDLDDAKKEATFSGNVTMTQGTLVIRGDRVIVKQDADGFQYGIAFGKPAQFRQKREAVDEYIEGFGERLEYDGRADKVQMFTNARVLRGGDEVVGDYISYNAVTEFYQVIGGKPSSAPGDGSGRVKAVIQPKQKPGAAAPGTAAPADLKPSATIAPRKP